jgi:copper chaperone CopZ
MQTHSLKVPKISCGHCVKTIQNELSNLVGVRSVEGDPGQKTITVGWDSPATLEAIRALLSEINYPAE